MKNKTIFNKNMREFEKCYPTMYNKVNSAEEPDNFFVEEAKNGLPTLYYQNDGKQLSIHSKYDPEMEAFRWAEGLGKDWDVLVLFGAGLGYHLLALTNLYPGKKVILVERDYGFLKQLMHYLDVSGVWKSNLELVISPDPQRTANVAGTYLIQNVSKNYIFKTLVAYETIYNDYWNMFRQVITDRVKSFNVDFFTRQRWQEQWFVNFRDNFLTYMETPGINNLFNKFKNIPVVIVSAGPSLEKNIHLLTKMKNKALIICGGSAIFPLLKRNITPDLFLSFDPSEANYNKIFSKMTRQDFPLVYGSTIYTRAVQEYEGPKYSFTVDVFNEWFEKQAELEKGTLLSGGTIAILCFNLAMKMGGNPIIFTGQDLAYTNLKKYAEGAEGEDDDLTIVGKEKHLFSVEGIGETVYTSRAFWSMKLQFDGLVKQAVSLGRTVVDATEGGVIIEGTKVIPLSAVIENYCREEHNVEEIINKPLHSKTPLTLEALEHLTKTLKDLRREQQLFHDCFTRVIQLFKKMLEHIENDNMKQSFLEQSLKEIKNCVRQVEKTGLFRQFIQKMIVHQLNALKSNIDKKVIDAKTPREKAQQFATGYAMVFQKMHESVSFLEEEIFKGIDKQLNNY